MTEARPTRPINRPARYTQRETIPGARPDLESSCKIATPKPSSVVMTTEELEAMVADAVTAERERCLKIIGRPNCTRLSTIALIRGGK